MTAVSVRPLRDTLPDDARIQCAIAGLRKLTIDERAIDDAIVLLEIFAKLRLRAERVETLLESLESNARWAVAVLRS